jgi:TM2 domain-containing membrane protein YozV
VTQVFNVESEDPIAPLLARFPGPVTLRPSLRTSLIALAFCVVLIALGVARVLNGELVVGWTQVVLMGAVVVYVIVSLLPGGSALILDGNGFTIRGRFRSRSHQWASTNSFEAVSIGRGRYVMFDDRQAVKIHHTGGLPDSYGLTDDEMVRLMSQWRQRAVASRTKR